MAEGKGEIDHRRSSKRGLSWLLTRLAEQPCVARQAEALQRLVAGSMLAPGHCGALGAGASRIAYAAAALPRSLAVASGAVAAAPTAG